MAKRLANKRPLLATAQAHAIARLTARSSRCNASENGDLLFRGLSDELCGTTGMASFLTDDDALPGPSAIDCTRKSRLSTEFMPSPGHRTIRGAARPPAELDNKCVSFGQCFHKKRLATSSDDQFPATSEDRGLSHPLQHEPPLSGEDQNVEGRPRATVIHCFPFGVDESSATGASIPTQLAQRVRKGRLLLSSH
jgi:hypothetical protein